MLTCLFNNRLVGVPWARAVELNIVGLQVLSPAEMAAVEGPAPTDFDPHVSLPGLVTRADLRQLAAARRRVKANCKQTVSETEA